MNFNKSIYGDILTDKEKQDILLLFKLGCNVIPLSENKFLYKYDSMRQCTDHGYAISRLKEIIFSAVDLLLNDI